jgi:hypothetical protein
MGLFPSLPHLKSKLIDSSLAASRRADPIWNFTESPGTKRGCRKQYIWVAKIRGQHYNHQTEILPEAKT